MLKKETNQDISSLVVHPQHLFLTKDSNSNGIPISLKSTKMEIQMYCQSTPVWLPLSDILNLCLSTITSSLSLNSARLLRIFPLLSIPYHLIYLILLNLKILLSTKLKRNIFSFARFWLNTINIVCCLNISTRIFVLITVI